MVLAAVLNSGCGEKIDGAVLSVRKEDVTPSPLVGTNKSFREKDTYSFVSDVGVCVVESFRNWIVLMDWHHQSGDVSRYVGRDTRKPGSQPRYSHFGQYCPQSVE